MSDTRTTLSVSSSSSLAYRKDRPRPSFRDILHLINLLESFATYIRRPHIWRCYTIDQMAYCIDIEDSWRMLMEFDF